jgi:monofunctional biosynthetic peptidoglycan transglycosylase
MKKNWQEKRFSRGGSSITQQLAKNLFLSPSRNPVRKLHEMLIAWEMERILGKRRILEIYLNVIEWGDGIYGAEAAARHYFGVSAASLNEEQAIFLSAIIPAPLNGYNPNDRSHYLRHRAHVIRNFMNHPILRGAPLF